MNVGMTESIGLEHKYSCCIELTISLGMNEEMILFGRGKHRKIHSLFCNHLFKCMASVKVTEISVSYVAGILLPLLNVWAYIGDLKRASTCFNTKYLTASSLNWSTVSPLSIRNCFVTNFRVLSNPSLSVTLSSPAVLEGPSYNSEKMT